MACEGQRQTVVPHRHMVSHVSWPNLLKTKLSTTLFAKLYNFFLLQDNDLLTENPTPLFSCLKKSSFFLRLNLLPKDRVDVLLPVTRLSAGTTANSTLHSHLHSEYSLSLPYSMLPRIGLPDGFPATAPRQPNRSSASSLLLTMLS